MGELSRRSGVPVPTIKFYVREGLLPPGRLTSPNQARYDAGHERRLRLIRALLDVGGLPLSAIRDVLRAMEDPAQPVHKVLGVAAKRLVPSSSDAPGPELEEAREEVAGLIERMGWRAGPASAGAESLAEVLVALRGAGHGAFIDLLDRYAAVAEQAALIDLGYVSRGVAREDLVESVVVGTVLGEAMFSALRRLAHAEASARAYEDGAPGDGAPGGGRGRGGGGPGLSRDTAVPRPTGPGHSAGRTPRRGPGPAVGFPSAGRRQARD
ncbi:MerR family transcriptional regulator [Streptomyces sp. SID9727]|uniref:MerR family transcriptional regulator n=1 Tax=Streptomyces sp. SID9727 TaxID=2706114 RepID=UPI001943D7E9|nr:MerR family transcriptional regulator [Streptomyces sp. SID9727]